MEKIQALQDFIRKDLEANEYGAIQVKNVTIIGISKLPV